MISIIHPSRNRPDLAYQTAEKWISNAGGGDGIEYILSIDMDDNQKVKYLSHLHYGLSKFTTCIYDNRSAIDAINKAAARSMGDILIVISDDFDCFPNWDVAIKNESIGRNDWILGTKDGIQDWVITLPIMDRTYFNRTRYIYNPNYMHAWCDTEMTCVAELTGRLVKTNLMFPHLHYSAPGGKAKDAVYERSDLHFEQGRKMFLERKKYNFFIHNPVGKLSQNIYTTMQ